MFCGIVDSTQKKKYEPVTSDHERPGLSNDSIWAFSFVAFPIWVRGARTERRLDRIHNLEKTALLRTHGPGPYNCLGIGVKGVLDNGVIVPYYTLCAELADSTARIECT